MFLPQLPQVLLIKDRQFLHIIRLTILHSGQKVGGGTLIFS